MSDPSPHRLERLDGQRDFPVDPDAIERELSALWREAGESRGGAAAVTRACLWNVVVQLPSKTATDGEPRRKAVGAAIDRLPAHLASRTLVLDVGPSEAGRPELDSWVSANCLLAEGGGKLVCSEEVTLAARGDGSRHLPALVRALLVPGVPTALLIPGAPDLEDDLTAAMLRVADRVIVDADAARAGPSLDALQGALASCRLGGLDLGWLRRSDFRGAVAALFDPPATQADIDAVRTVRLHAGADEAGTARLLLGWALDALGARDLEATGEGTWRAERAGASLDIALTTASGADELRLSFEREDSETKDVRCGARLVSRGAGAGPDRPHGVAAFEALVARALASRSEDAGFVAALARARTLP